VHAVVGVAGSMARRDEGAYPKRSVTEEQRSKRAGTLYMIDFVHKISCQKEPDPAP
jgi:hypothetical protein